MTRLFFTWFMLVHACFYEVVKHSDSSSATEQDTWPANRAFVEIGYKVTKKQIKKEDEET